ncbi:hypothetical protein [Catenuloplanes japonicus]|uniref:hypothetical protein n=1 Tax=Catenuloplanes japonicus TaxID=33876 RepID=UPI0005272ADA|nr:hypothetical protein [Catenuloplanes japonicus]
MAATVALSPLAWVLFLLLMFGAFCLSCILSDLIDEFDSPKEGNMNGAKKAICSMLSVGSAVLINFAAAATG